MRATAKKLRFHSKEILESVKRGKEVTKQHKLFGIWSDYGNVEDVNGYVRELREGRRYDN